MNDNDGKVAAPAENCVGVCFTVFRKWSDK
jgi:hypothetical protein